jgi:hypothetical protein
MKLFASICAFSGALCLACGSGESRVIFECSSPSAETIASFYSSSGGGAAGWALLRIGVRPAGVALDPESYVFQMRHGYDAQLEWSSDTDLVIRYPDSAELDVKTPTAGSVSVRYEPLPSSQGVFADGSAEGCKG